MSCEEQQEFIVGGADPPVLATLAEEVDADPDVELHEVQGAREAPSLLVVRAPSLEALNAKVAGRATVEPNAPLDMLEPG